MNMVCGIEYQGTNFFGFQRQKSAVRTIQAVLEKAISKFANHNINIVCAGRTDKGVHASYQIISFQTNVIRSDYSWLLGLNTYLPKDVRVLWVKPVADDFHARFSATHRRYRYYIYNHRVRPSLHRDILTWECKQLNLQTMQEAVKYLVGKHDFSAFRASYCQAKNPNRHVEFIEVVKFENIFMLDIKANAFLYHMVRNIVGVLLEIGFGNKPSNWAKKVLESKSRVDAGVTAAANGLFLVEVNYPNQYNIPKAKVKAPLLFNI